MYHLQLGSGANVGPGRAAVKGRTCGRSPPLPSAAPGARFQPRGRRRCSWPDRAAPLTPSPLPAMRHPRGSIEASPVARLLPLVAVLLSSFLASPRPAFAQDHAHPETGELVGSVSLPTSCSPAVQPAFDRAVAMLHSFWFERAEAEFREIAAADTRCAMAQWGIAMTLWGNPMTRAAPPAERQGLAAEASTTARTLAATATRREQLYADAAVALYENWEQVAHLTRMQAHEDAMRRVTDAYPDDAEATIFLGRIMVANGRPDDLSFSRQRAAAALMEPLFARMPDHPGLAHYIIHAFDAPATADEGLAAARAYAEIAPAAPHALHMPSHIFTRLGYWQESVETNARSAAAEPVPDAAVHPLDYMVYAHLQMGQDAAAGGIVGKARAISDRYYAGLLGYNFAAMHARYALERDRWAEAAEVPVPTGALPYVEAVAHFARAVGAARSGNPDRAQAEVRMLADLAGRLEQQGDPYWPSVVNAQRLAAAAWEARVRGDDAGAVRLATEAADLEATFEKHPVTPGPLLPARELLGDLLLELGRPAEALAAYRQTLEREPNRARTLYGAARAAEAVDAAAARGYYQQLLELMADADTGRPEVGAARRYLGRQGDPLR